MKYTFSLIAILLVLLCILLCPFHAWGQGSRADNVVFRGGVGIGGVKVAVCQPLATTAASVTSNLATYTMSSNPQTAGFVAGMTVQVAGFTGGDTYYNAGTITNNQITGGQTILVVTTSTIVTSLTHANASAGTNGTLLQMGNTVNGCGGLSIIYSDSGLSSVLPNPVTTDGLGNYGFWAAPGIYYTQYYGSTVTTTLKYLSVPGSSVFTGTVSTNQIPFATAPNTLGGSANMTYTGGAINLNSTGSSCSSAGNALLSFSNSGGGSVTSYIQKCQDNSLFLNGDGSLIPGHGFFGFNCQGGASTCDIDMRPGSNGTQLYCNTIANVGITLPQGSCRFTIFVGGVGTAKIDFFAGSPINNDMWWDAGTGCSTWHTTGSLTNGGGWCPPASGSPNLMNFPIANPSAGQFMEGDGSNPIILTWKTTGVQCGTLAANAACPNTLTQAEHCVSGQATLSAGASTITGISPAFTSSTSFSVITNDNTTIANPSKGVGASGSSITFTGTGTDVLNFVACGG